MNKRKRSTSMEYFWYHQSRGPTVCLGSDALSEHLRRLFFGVCQCIRAASPAPPAGLRVLTMHKALTGLGVDCAEPGDLQKRRDSTAGRWRAKSPSTAGVGVRWQQGAHMDPALRNEKG